MKSPIIVLPLDTRDNDKVIRHHRNHPSAQVLSVIIIFSSRIIKDEFDVAKSRKKSPYTYNALSKIENKFRIVEIDEISAHVILIESNSFNTSSVAFDGFTLPSSTQPLFFHKVLRHSIECGPE